MKFINCLLVILIFCSCTKNYGDYKLIHTNYSKDILVSKEFINIENPNKKKIEYYWDNGKIMTRAFYLKNLKSGIWEFYNMQGEKKETFIYRNDTLIQINKIRRVK